MIRADEAARAVLERIRPRGAGRPEAALREALARPRDDAERWSARRTVALVIVVCVAFWLGLGALILAVLGALR